MPNPEETPPPPAVEESKPEEIQSKTEEDPTTRAALDLYNNLNDPSKAREIVKVLAARSGLQIQEEGTEPKVAVKQTIADLKEGIAPELHFLIDGLRPAIEKMVNQSIESAITPVKQAQLQDREQVVMAQVNNAYDTMRSKHKDFDKYEGIMNKLAEDMPYKTGSDMTKYLDNLYKLATFETKEGEAVKSVVGKINKNAQQAKVQSAETAEETVQIGSKLPSLREAVNAAVRGVRFQ